MANLAKPPITFIPRCVAHKKKVNKGKCKETSKQKIDPSPGNVNKDGSECKDDDEIKNFSTQQRWPGPNEPVCVICKKFGEYICDETDEDVCSLECKAKHLTSLKSLNEESKEIESISSVELFDAHYLSKMKYSPSKIVASTSESEMTAFRERLQIRTKGVPIPKLIFNFNQCSFSETLLYNMTENGFITPTPVQMQAIPIIISGKDVLVSASTSSGKTASFLLPIIHNIYRCIGELPSSHDYCRHPVAMVLAPTRELCIQIEEIAKVLCKSLSNLRTALLIGGVPLPPQLHRLRHKIQLLIGTPGRINDILQNHESALHLQRIKMIVLDEVDVMLQMGFHNQISYIAEQLICKPQYMMFSATIPPYIEDLASKMMTDPLFVSVGLPGLPDRSVKQIVLWVEETSKKKKLFSIIQDSKHFLPPVLIFVESKLGADMLSEAISRKFSLHCESIHSDKLQCERTKILQNFIAGVYDILVATNVIGRGIDLVNTRQVILFDMPNTIEEYVHQIGRCGGLNTSGFAISFINNSSKKIFIDLKKLFELSGHKLPDELVHSPFLALETKKRERKRKQLNYKRALGRSDEIVNPQSLLEILRKNRKLY